MRPGRRSSGSSGGQQQRLSLALALVGRPELLFLDEPTTGMDPQARRTTWELIRRLRHDGVSVVLTTHYLDEAEELADHVVMLHAGRVVAEGSPAELTKQGSAGTVRFSARPGLAVAALQRSLPAGATVTEPSPALTWSGPRSRRRCWPRSRPGVRPNRSWPRASRVERRSLEDVFLAVTGRATAQPGGTASPNATDQPVLR